MLSHTVDFYKNLFGEEESMGVHLGENFWEEDKISIGENELLEAPFSEEEIKAALFESYAEGWLFFPLLPIFLGYSQVGFYEVG